ncbi:ABC transporter ATP-binding protein/permease [Bacillus massiliglaciei]|uniref:ABC transporter ATP-binding protein/permease n=1 Tax=Bacillus massiliglaciei TaxID=1816693 RepID=UPI000A8DB05D|nr:ABC transporter ATP-binding protein/permease [Bacillus massiliglaciei]
MISLKSIEKHYKLADETVPVLKEVDLELNPGQLSYLFGESGCGKSTLLNIIGGIDEATEGEYFFHDKNVTGFSEKDWAFFRRKKIGFVFQNFNLVPHLTAIENVEMSMILEGLPKTERRGRAKELLESVGLKDRAFHLPKQLSGGQKQRVAIARSLANNPDIILADEPTGALDSENSKQIMSLLKQVANQGKIVLVVTHSQEFLHYADRIIHMKDGTITKIEQTAAQKHEHPAIDSALSHKGKKINWATTLKLAVRNLRNKKWRSTLTAIGASIGIFGIILIGALGNGVKEKITSTVDGTVAHSSIAVYKEDTELLPNTMIHDLEKTENIEAVYTYNPFTISITTKEGKRETSSADTLVPASHQSIYGKSYITEGDYPSKNHEVVIPERLAQKLFGSNTKQAIGQQVTIIAQLMSLKDVYQTVKTEAAITGISKNGAIPLLDSVGFSYPLALSVTNDNPQTKQTALQYTAIPSSPDKADSVIKSLQSKGYKAETEGDSGEELSNYVTMAGVAVGLLSAISLIVSSIMIGIVLYVSVLERTKEIGTLKAIGAYRSDIRRIFVTEGFMIGMLGGLFGAAGSMAIGKLANFIIKAGFEKPNLQLFQFDINQMLIIIVFSGLLGAAASFIPAFRASRMKAAEALKYE